LFGLVVDPHGEHLLVSPAEPCPHLPAALASGEASGSAPLVDRVELIDLDDEVGLRYELPSQVASEALDASLAEVGDPCSLPRSTSLTPNVR
jgi:hypothetical protein